MLKALSILLPTLTDLLSLGLRKRSSPFLACLQRQTQTQFRMEGLRSPHLARTMRPMKATASLPKAAAPLGNSPLPSTCPLTFLLFCAEITPVRLILLNWWSLSSSILCKAADQPRVHTKASSPNFTLTLLGSHRMPFRRRAMFNWKNMLAHDSEEILWPVVSASR